MVFLRLLEYAIVVFIIVFAVTQTIVPILRGKPMFPFFSKKEKIRDQLIATKDDVDLARIEKEIKSQQERAKKLRGE